MIFLGQTGCNKDDFLSLTACGFGDECGFGGDKAQNRQCSILLIILADDDNAAVVSSSLVLLLLLLCAMRLLVA